MCPLQVNYSYINNNIHFENQNNHLDINDNNKKKNTNIYWKPYISSSSLLSHGRSRVLEFSILSGGGVGDSAGLERTTRAGFRFRRDFSGCPNARFRESSGLFHVLTTILQALGWGTLRVVLLSRGIPRGCWDTAHHPRGGGRGGRRKIMQDAPGGWERKKGRWKRNKIKYKIK